MGSKNKAGFGEMVTEANNKKEAFVQNLPDIKVSKLDNNQSKKQVKISGANTPDLNEEI
jgi:hypothetical protein